MELSTAIRLIDRGVLKTNEPQRWADLGAGNGFFTRALASIIPQGSSVVAVDKSKASLRSIPWTSKEVTLAVHPSDFTSLTWGEDFDGILMANALHYVSAQSDFLRKLKVKLSPRGRLLIVEYERKLPNSWVPYPVAFEKLREQATVAGLAFAEKLDETASTFDHVTLYSACLIP